MFTWRGFCRVSLYVCGLAAIALAPFGSARAEALTRYVSTAGADASDCSSASNPCLTINYAIAQAVAGDTIDIAQGTYTLPSGATLGIVVEIAKSLTLSGGWDDGFTTQSGLSTIDGRNIGQGIRVGSGAHATVDHVLVQNGYSNLGGGIRNEDELILNDSVIQSNWATNMGGGIFSLGPLTVNDSIINGNTAGQPRYSGGGGGAGIEQYAGTLEVNNTRITNNRILGYFSGSAIDILGSGRLNNSTVSGNSAETASAIHLVSGSLTLNNSTVSGNTRTSTTLYGTAGILSIGRLTLNNSTVVGNVAANGLGGIGNGESRPDTVVVRNSLIAGNIGAGGRERDCQGLINSAGYNLLGSNLNCTFAAAEGDIVGTDASPIDPGVLPLDEYGGPTLTHALRPDSPAQGAGNPALPGSGGDACLATDQRGFDRIEQGPCDIGAYQIQRPAVASIRVMAESPTGASSVAFAVTFTDAVTGVDASDFQLATEGIDGAVITGVTSSGDNYAASVNTGTGQGTIRLDLIDDDSIIDASGKPLGGPGLKNGDFRYGEAYVIDKIPLVSAVTRLDPDPTSAASVRFAVTFSRPVSEVDEAAPFADFALTTTGVPGAAITAVSGAGAEYVVSASTGAGNGTMRLDVLDDDRIVDEWGNPLGGLGIGNGIFTAGETYTVIRIPTPLSPAGVITESRPTYTWSLVPGAVRYQYELLQDGDAILKKTVFSDECGATTCSDTPPKTLKPGVYTWNVKAMIDGAWYEWSEPVEFTVVVP